MGPDLGKRPLGDPLLDYALGLKREVEMLRSRPSWTGWLRFWRSRRRCWHHDRTTGRSWLKDQLINTGMGKMIWCTHCERTWFV